VEYLFWQASGLLERAPNLTASSYLALPDSATWDWVWKRRREVISAWVRSSIGVAAISHTYLLPQLLLSMELMASKMNCSPTISSSTTDLFPLLVAALRARAARAPAPAAAATPPRPAAKAVPEARPLMARPVAAVPVVAVPPPMVKKGKPTLDTVPRLIVHRVAGIARARVATATKDFIFELILVGFVDQVYKNFCLSSEMIAAS
jgi:hypothetical protein